MAKSDSESSSSASSSSSSSSSTENSSADEGHLDIKNVVEKKKTKAKQKRQKDLSTKKYESVDETTAKNKENNSGAMKIKETKEAATEKKPTKSRERKQRNDKHQASSASSSSDSSSSSGSSSEGEISSSDSSSTNETQKKNIKKQPVSEKSKEKKEEEKPCLDSSNNIELENENNIKEKVTILEVMKIKEISVSDSSSEKENQSGKKEILTENATKETAKEKDVVQKAIIADCSAQEEIKNSVDAGEISIEAQEGNKIDENVPVNVQYVDEKKPEDHVPIAAKISNDSPKDDDKNEEALQVIKTYKDSQHEEGELQEEAEEYHSDKEKSPTIDSTGPKKLQSIVVRTNQGRSKSRTRSKSCSPQKSRKSSKEREIKSRSRSRSYTRSRSRSYSKERRSDKRSERRRSLSADLDRRRSRRSESVERRREERKRRHAERDEKEKSKRARRDEENAERREKELNKPDGDPDKVNELDNTTVTDPKAKITERQRKTVDLLTSRTGGAYIPPAKLRLMQAQITDKASAAYQRIAWEALKKSIHGYINKVNVDNIAIITRELLKENIVRGRGLLCRSIIQAQSASPTFTHVYAALVSIINSKFPNIGELLLKRLVIQFKRAFRRNDKTVCLSSSRFIAHLVNQRVAHEILALEILTLLVESPTDDSVEVAIAFLKECGMKLTEVSSKGIGAIFEMLKNILHEGKLDKRVQYMIEVVFQVRKDGFKDHQSVLESLELVEEDDQFTHLLMLDEANNTEDMLNAFKFDEQYAINEDKYKGLSKEILGSDASDSEGSSSGSGSGSDSDSSDSDETNEKGEGKPTAEEIIDNTETNLIALRRTIYLTINSSLDYEECAHKLMKMQLKPGQEIELCHMFLDCCAEQRTYEKFYGLLAQRFCSINKIYIEPFEEIFKDTYQTTHRLDTNRLRNVSKFFAHLLFTDAISWDVLECIKLNEEDTTSSSRIFIKILFQELAEYMGLSQLNKKLKDDVLLECLAGLFPKDNPRNTRFSINFFTSIGLGGLTDELRHFLKNAPKSVPAINAEILANKPINVESSASSSSSSSSSAASSSSSGSSSSESSSSESESDSEIDKKKRKTKKKNKKSASKKKKQKKSKKTKTKTKKNNRKSKKSKKPETSDDSSSSESESESESNSSSSESSSEDEKRKSKKKNKTKKKMAKSTKNSKKNKQKSKSEDSDEEEKDKRQKLPSENGFAYTKEKRQQEFDDNRRDRNVVRNDRPNRPEPQRRDSEVERRREEREKRHRDKEQTRNERERKRSVSRSRKDDRDRGERERKRSPSRSRDRRDDRGTRDYERERDSERRRDRKRYDDRDDDKSRSRSRSRERKRERDLDRSKPRNNSKERG